MNKPRLTLPDRPKIPFTAEGLVDAVEIMTREVDEHDRLERFAEMLRDLAAAVQERAAAVDFGGGDATTRARARADHRFDSARGRGRTL